MSSVVVEGHEHVDVAAAPYPRRADAKAYLEPSELAALVKYLKASGHKYFPQDNTLRIPFSQHLKDTNATVALFRWSYPELAWEPEILQKGGFNFGRQILELGSGNNNLVTSPCLTQYLRRLSSDAYVLSNYSGGRGDYFSLCHLATAISDRISCSARQVVSVSYLDLCHTSGAQGGLSGVANYFAEFHPGQAIAMADSTYCGMQAPFAAHGVPVRFVPTGDSSRLPRIEDILAAVRQPDVSAYVLIPFHNPSGELHSEEDLALLCSELRRLGKYLIVSEVYDGMGWNSTTDITAQLDSLLCRTDLRTAIRLFSLSKSRGLAGLRAGYIQGPASVCTHVAQVNALHSFNPPMVNAKLILLHELLGIYGRTGSVAAEALQYLQLTCDDFAVLFREHQAERATLNLKTSENFMLLVSRLLGKPPMSRESLAQASVLSNEHYDIVVPRGGMNCCVRLKQLEHYDQVDLFRKMYLWSGLIMHTSRYLSAESGTWVRVTLTHEGEMINQSIESLIQLQRAHTDLLIEPRGAISIEVV